MTSCILCPRKCGVNREAGQTGRCGETAVLRAGLAWLHQWEEPCLTGEKGSGAVFFSGCSLGCIFCQNYALSHKEGAQVSADGIPADPAHGRTNAADRMMSRRVSMTEDELAEVFLRLQSQGAANINLVTACHFIPQVRAALMRAKGRGLKIPVVYNSSGYESVSSLKMLEGLVDIYLPDFKFMDPDLAAEYAGAPDYPEAAKAAISEMVRQCCAGTWQGPDEEACLSAGNADFSSALQYDEKGIMTRGVIVRHMLLPGHVKDSKRILSWLHDTFGKRILISVMNQYTPMPIPAVRCDPLLSRKVTAREYRRLLAHAMEIGIEDGYFQEGPTARESFVPAFDGTGL